MLQRPSETGHCIEIARLDGFCKPSFGFHKIARRAFAETVAMTKLALRCSVTSLGSQQPPLHRRLVRSLDALVIRVADANMVLGYGPFVSMEGLVGGLAVEDLKGPAAQLCGTRWRGRLPLSCLRHIG